MESKHILQPLSSLSRRNSSILTIMELPVIDLAPYLKLSAELIGDDEVDSQLKLMCSELSQTLRESGALLVKDPRCSSSDGDNDRFIDMMENYFEKPDDFKRLQERPLLRYQVLFPLHLHNLYSCY